jgi:predicted nuclease with TOPRIM domain
MVIRVLYYLPMERMKDLTQQYVEQLENMVKDLREEKFNLEEENKNLSDEIRQLKSDLEECECSMHFENDEV